MTDKTLRDDSKPSSKGPPNARPDSVGPHGIKKDQTDPSNKGVNPEAYDTGPSTDLGPGGPVNIGVKSQPKPGG